MQLRLVVTTPGSDHRTTARDLRLMRNGVLINHWPGKMQLDTKGRAVIVADVVVERGPNIFTAFCFNSENVKSDDASLQVVGDQTLTRTKRQFVLAIGIDEYTDPELHLRYAASDAKLIAVFDSETSRTSAHRIRPQPNDKYYRAKNGSSVLRRRPWS